MGTVRGRSLPRHCSAVAVDVSRIAMDMSLKPGRQSQVRRVVRRPSMLAQQDHNPAFCWRCQRIVMAGWWLDGCGSCGGWLAVLVWTVPCMAVQAVLLLLPGERQGPVRPLLLGHVHPAAGRRGPSRRSARLPVRADQSCSSPTIPPGSISRCLAARCSACFVSKAEVARWPMVSWIARLGRRCSCPAAAPPPAGSAMTCVPGCRPATT